MKMPFPSRGVSDALAYEHQALITSRDMQNMRIEDRVTGRARGGQRGGWKKLGTDQVDPGGTPEKVATLGHVTYDNPSLLTYANIADVSLAAEWTKQVPSKKPVKNGKVDNQQNVYALDGPAGIVKFNSAGKQLLTASVPTSDKQHECLALAVDPVEGAVYVGVSTGGDQKKAILVKFIQIEESTKFHLAWQKPLVTGCYFADISLFGGRLYTVQEDKDQNRGWLRVYHAIDSASPELAWEREVTSLPKGIDVKDDGSCVVSFAPDSKRGVNPLAPNLGPRAVSWTPKDLPDWQARIWNWFEADKVNGEGVPPLEDGDEVFTWFDLTDNNRNLFAATQYLPSPRVQMTAPRYTKNGIGGLPGIRFDGKQNIVTPNPVTGALYNAMGLQSNIASSSAAGYQEQMRTLLPSFTGAMWATVMVLRPVVAGPGESPSTAIGVLLNAHNQSSGYGHLPWTIFVNKQEADNFGGPLDPGKISIYEKENSTGAYDGGGTDNNPVEGDYNNTASAIVVTIIHHGNQGVVGAAGALDETRSLWRINGQQRDRWRSHEFESIARATLGYIEQASWEGSGHARFVMSAMITLTRKRTAAGVLETTEPILVSHPVGATSTAPASYTYVPTSSSAFLNELEMLEGYVGWKYGIAFQHFDTQHPWKFAPPPAPSLTTINLTGATYTPADNKLTLAGAFTNYTFTDGDEIITYETSGVTARRYVVTSKFDNDTIVLFSDPRAANGTVNAMLMPQNDESRLSHGSGLLAKFGPDGGALKWCVSLQGGVGYAAAVLPTGSVVDKTFKEKAGNIVALGPVFAGSTHQPAEATNMRLITDNGDTFSIGTEVTFSNTMTDAEAGSKRYGLAVDQAGNSYFPIYNTDTNYSDLWTIKVFNSSLTGIAEYDVATLGNGVPSYAIAIPPSFPDYPSSVTNQRSEFAYVFTHDKAVDGAPTGLDTVRKIRLVSQTIGAVAPRLTKKFAVANGRIMIHNGTTWEIPSGSGTKAQPELDATSQWIDWTILNGLVFFADGVNLVVYDPKLDKAYDLVPQGSGKPLERTKLIATWNGRLVIGRGRDDPQNWMMSKQLDPFTWDIFPKNIENDVPPDQAIDGVNSLAGKPPDIINTLIPYSDDWLIFGCDHSIWYLAGDPLAGGRLYLLTDVTGIAFGRPWCKDDQGNLYFYGSRGGIWRMRPGGGEPTEITEESIARRMRAANLSTYHVRMEWDDAEGGVLTAFCPFGAGAAAIRSHFWWRETEAWLPESYLGTATAGGAPGNQPTCMHVFDGDAVDDRVIAFGCEDGWVRTYTRSAKNDDDTAASAVSAIDSFVIFGPYTGDDLDRELKLIALRVQIAGDQDGCHCEVFVADNAERAVGGGYSAPGTAPPVDLGVPVWEGWIKPGVNITSIRRTGSYFWVRLRNAAAAESWSFEAMAAEVGTAGRRRVTQW